MTTALPDDSVSHDARLRVMAARVIAQQRWPYLSSVLFSLRLVQVSATELETVAVDSGWRLYYSSEFVLDQTPEALATVLLHESLHCIHSHADRFQVLRRPEAHVVWNIAGDAGINEILDESSMPWPSVEPVRIKNLTQFNVTRDMSTEAIFFAILEGRASTGLSSDCGSVTDFRRRNYELPAADSTHPSLRTDQQSVIRDRTAHEVLQRDRHYGDVPGGLLRWATDLLEPTINWREELASRLRRDIASIAGRRDYSYTRPSRRQSAMNAIGSSVILPAMTQPAPPRVACVIDTSGSISDSELRDFASELVGISRAAGLSGGVTVIPCDASPGPVQRVRRRSDIEQLELSGGGGTDMTEGIRAAQKLSPRPHILVVFTDGYTPWPGEKPSDFNSVIIVLSDSSSQSTVPSWAHLIEMTRKDVGA